MNFVHTVPNQTVSRPASVISRLPDGLPFLSQGNDQHRRSSHDRQYTEHQP